MDAAAAREAAVRHLILNVGDLYDVREPQLGEGCDWVLDVTVGNVFQGVLGVVGSITVDAESGAVLFLETDLDKLDG